MTITYPVILGGVEINDDNKVIRMTEVSTVNLTIIDPATGVAIPSGTRRTFFVLGDGTNDDLCRALKLTFDSHTNAVNPNTYSVTPTFTIDPTASAAGTVAIARTAGSSTFGFLFGNASTTFDETLIGFSGDTAVDATTKTSSKSPGAVWVSPEVYRSFEPDESYDAAVVRADGGQVRVTRTGGPFKDKRLELRMVDSRRAIRDDNTTDPDATFAKFLERFGDGPRLRIITMPISSGFALNTASVTEVGGGWYFGPDIAKRFNPARVTPGLSLYDWDVDLLGYVA